MHRPGQIPAGLAIGLLAVNDLCLTERSADMLERCWSAPSSAASGMLCSADSPLDISSGIEAEAFSGIGLSSWLSWKFGTMMGAAEMPRSIT